MVVGWSLEPNLRQNPLLSVPPNPYALLMTHNPRTAMIFDFETTGMIDRNLPPEAPEQPDIVQMAMVLCEGVGEGDFAVRRGLSFIVRPPFKTIHPKARAVHKIGPEEIDRFEVPLGLALDQFADMVGRADVLVAFNLPFDAMVARTAWHRSGRGDLRELLVGKRALCAMRAATPLCKIPNPRGRHREDWKWPSLSEATEFFFGERLVKAHDALADVTATARIFYEIERRKGLTVGESSATYSA